MKTTAPQQNQDSNAISSVAVKATANPLQLKTTGLDEEKLQLKQNPLQLRPAARFSTGQNPLQAKSTGQNPLQFKLPANNPLQLPQYQAQLPAQKKANNTGLADDLKDGVEDLSGYSMDDVKVHYNSDKPAQLQALAYAQGTDIHVAPGQEKQLPHEAWHVVQQKQGRVQPTLQMKGGISVNDDKGLEQEADVMGSSALQFKENNATIEEALSNTNKLTSNSSVSGIHQLYQAFELGNKNENFLSLLNDTKQQLLPVNWVHFAENVYELVENYLVYVESDNDLKEEEKKKKKALLEECEKETDDLVESGNETVVIYNKTNLNQNRSKEKVRLQNVFNKIRNDIVKIQATIDKEFSISVGGFSAVGRANNLYINITDLSTNQKWHKDDKTEIKQEETKKNTLTKENNEFINETKTNNSSIKEQYKIEKEDKALGQSSDNSLRINILGKLFIQKNVTDKEKENLKSELDTKVSPVETPEKKEFTNKAVYKIREVGQDSAMSNTNARGYAWLTGTENWDKVRWEWLHIKAASLEGKTHATNLVLGTRDSNTHMMPFESHIVLLSAIIAEEQKKDNNEKKYSKLEVVWGLENVNKHLVNAIKITWKLYPTDNEQKEVYNGEATFYPLKGESIISKSEVELLQYILKKQRNDIRDNEKTINNIDDERKNEFDERKNDIYDYLQSSYSDVIATPVSASLKTREEIQKRIIRKANKSHTEFKNKIIESGFNKATLKVEYLSLLVYFGLITQDEAYFMYPHKDDFGDHLDITNYSAGVLHELINSKK